MRDVREFGFRALCGAGLGVSVALVREYARAAPAICRPGGGCDVVRTSEYASLLGVPTPVFGVVFFAAALVLAAIPGALSRGALVVWSAGGALAAAALLAIQGALIGAFCVACVIANGAALAMLPLALWGRREPPYPRARVRASTALAALVAAAPFAYSVALTAEAPAVEGEIVDELPPAIAERQVEGKVTIVEFIDFQCPFCRHFHGHVRDVAPAFEGQLAVEKLHMPMRQNPHSETAAAAALCADELGRGEGMTDALMEAERIDVESIIELAQDLGIGEDELAQCVGAPETRAELDEHIEAARELEVRALPTIYIGRERFEGALPEAEDVERAIERAIERGDDAL